MLAIEARESRNAAGAALLMHALLAAGLLVSLNWTRQPNTPVQAELWSGLPRQIPATTTPAVTAPAPTPPKPAPPEPTKADISVQKKKPEPPKEDLAKKRELQKEAERKEAAKKAAEKKIAEQRAAEKLQAQRQAELARLGLDPNAKANAKGKDVATKAGVVGGAEIGSKTGVDAEYEAQIQARVKIRIKYPDRSPGNPEAIVRVEQLPTGEVIKVQLIKPSGTPAWDSAVQRAIWDASPLPKKKDGTVARVLELSFRPKENP